MSDRMLTMAEAVREAMTIAMEERPEVFLMGEDVGIYGGAFGVSAGMYEKFGAERVIDTPISELGYIGAAVGAALSGMRPIAEIQFSDFSAQAMDQIANQAAKIHFMLGGALHVPMVIRAPQGSGTGALTHTIDRTKVRRVSSPEIIRRSVIDFDGQSDGWALPLLPEARLSDVEADPDSLRINSADEVTLMEAFLHWQQRIAE